MNTNSNDQSQEWSGQWSDANRPLTPEEEALRMAMAKREQVQRAAYAAAPKPQPKESHDPEYVRKGNVQERLSKPTIPSREQASAAGMTSPDPQSFQLAMGIIDIEGVEFPKEPDSVYKIAYELLPAWIVEYGDRYPIKPHMVLKAWLLAIDAIDENAKDELTRNTQRIDAWQLQAVVFHMSEAAQQFNPRTMNAVAAKIFNTDLQAKYATQEAFAKRNPFYYEFFRTVNPEVSSAPKQAQAWTTHAGYPDQFPTDITVPALTLKAIDHAVQDRYESDEQVCSTCARWLAGEMLQVVQHFLRDKGTTFTPQHILELAYRYSPAWIHSASMCKDRSHGSRASFRNHLDDGPRSKGFDVSDMNLDPRG